MMVKEINLKLLMDIYVLIPSEYESGFWNAVCVYICVAHYHLNSWTYWLSFYFYFRAGLWLSNIIFFLSLNRKISHVAGAFFYG
jgi:hypothetical protein